jgi:hypothetical protein
MKILVAYEYSGRVREAFRALGHDVISCDFEESDDTSPYHYVGDVLELISELGHEFDLMIAHPPCTYLTVSANKWFKDQPPRASGVLVGQARRDAREEAVDFFMKLYNCPIPKIAIENPIGTMSSRFRKPNQVIQPWMFGLPVTKATCLWTRGLPNLTPTNEIKEEMLANPNREYSQNLPPSPTRWKERSRTYQGIADAMASQWGQ